jgi:hypothetical protein
MTEPMSTAALARPTDACDTDLAKLKAEMDAAARAPNHADMVETRRRYDTYVEAPLSLRERVRCANAARPRRGQGRIAPHRGAGDHGRAARRTTQARIDP